MTRRCGDCQLCCKLMPMTKKEHPDVPFAIDAMISHGLVPPDYFDRAIADFDKPAGERCPHQKHGKGCTIYPSRPFGCRAWSCRWLTGDDTADLRRPDRSHYVIDSVEDFITVTFGEDKEARRIPVIVIWVDRNYPEAHKDPALRSYIERRGADGFVALIRLSERDAYVLVPPIMADDGKWHEVGSHVQGITVESGEQHNMRDIFEVMAQTRARRGS